MTGRILIIEDSADLLEGMKATLEDEGFEVDTALDAATGTAKALEAGYDLAIVDIGLPDGRGTEICEIIHTSHHIPVIMFTGEADRPTVATAVDSGAFDYVLKGSGLEELVRRVHKRLTKAA